MAKKLLKAHVKDDFKDLLEFRKWVVAGMANLTEPNRPQLPRFTPKSVDSRIKYDEAWYGKGALGTDIIDGITQYMEPRLIESLLAKIKHQIPSSSTDRIQLKRMSFNDQGIGLFSFDRAAMGLYRLKEFFSESQNRKVEREECSETDAGWILDADGSEVVERWEQKPDGKPKVRTNSRKVFASFPKANKEREAVEIYIACGGHARISANDLLYSGLSAIVVAELLQMARIPTKISIALGSTPDSWQNVYLSLVPVKNFDEPLDSNLLATLTSDPRFFRHEGFKGVVATYDHFKVECPYTLGSPVVRSSLIESIENSTYTKSAKLAPNRMYFGGTYSERDAISQIDQAIDLLAKKLNR